MYICIVLVIFLYCWFWAGLVPFFGVSVVDFGQVNASWEFEILMRRSLLTDGIFDRFIYFVEIFCSIGLCFTVNFTNFDNYLTFIMK